MVIAGRQQMSVHVRVPREPVAFLLMTSKAQIGMADAIRIRFGWVFRVIKYKHVATRCLGSNDAWILRHIAK